MHRVRNFRCMLNLHREAQAAAGGVEAATPSYCQESAEVGGVTARGPTVRKCRTQALFRRSHHCSRTLHVHLLMGTRVCGSEGASWFSPSSLWASLGTQVIRFGPAPVVTQHPPRLESSYFAIYL